MTTASERMRAVLIAGAVATSLCACREPRAEREPPAASATAKGAPAVWEPIDKDFKGCEGG